MGYSNTDMRIPKLLVPIVLWTATAIFAFGLAELVLLGQYARPFQDDFYYYPPTDQTEMHSLLNERYNWTGRFTATTIHLAVGWSQMHWIVPFISFVVMMAGIYAFSSVLLTKLLPSRLLRRSVALTLGTGLTLAIFLATPSPYSSIFWLSAAPIHFWSYGLLLLYLAYLIRRLTKKPRFYDYPVMLVAPLVIGMMGEVAMFAAAASIGLVLIFARLYQKKNIIWPTTASVIGLGLAFLALFFSNGAAVRRGSESTVPVGELITHTPYLIAKNFYTLGTSLLSNKTVLIVVLLLAIILGISFGAKYIIGKRTYINVAALTIVCVGVMCLNFIGVYSSVKLNVAWDRTQAFSVIVIIGLLMMYGTLVGVLIKQHAKNIASATRTGLLVLVLGIVGLEGGYIPYMNEFAGRVKERAVAYDAREHTIKTEKITTCPVALPATEIKGMQEGQDLWEDPNHALNVGVKRYYRLACGVTK